MRRVREVYIAGGGFLRGHFCDDCYVLMRTRAFPMTCLMHIPAHSDPIHLRHASFMHMFYAFISLPQSFPHPLSIYHSHVFVPCISCIYLIHSA